MLFIFNLVRIPSGLDTLNRSWTSSKASKTCSSIQLIGIPSGLDTLNRFCTASKAYKKCLKA